MDSIKQKYKEIIQPVNAQHEASVDLKNLLQSIVPIPDSEWDWLAKKLKKRKYLQSDKLFKLDESDSSIHFLYSGLVRYFYLTEDGKERNHAFASKGNLVGCFRSFIGAGSCTYTIESLEPTNTLVIPPTCIQEMNERHDCWVQLKQFLVEQVALRKEAREAEFLLNSAETRYQCFLEQHGSLSQRIPQYHIASYLGITPVGLSRIRKRIIPG